MKASILIVTRNNARTLAETVAACVSQRGLPTSDYEVVVLDDDSGHDQQNLLANLARTYAPQIDSGHFRIVRSVMSRGLAHQRNVAAGEARGEFLAFVDGDGTPTPDWLREALRPMRDSSVGGVSSQVVFGGAPEVANGQGGTLSRYGFGIDRYVFQPVINMPSQQEDVLYAMGCGMVVRRSVWEEVGGFDALFSSVYDDVDLCVRIHQKGYRIVTAPNARVLHHTVSFDGPNRDRIFRNTRARWIFLLKYWRFAWLIKAAFLQGCALLFTPDGRANAPVYLRAIGQVAQMAPRIIRARCRRTGKRDWERFVCAEWTGPVGLYRDLRFLQQAPLNPMMTVDWRDGDAYRLVGGHVHLDQDDLSIIPHGWCEVALFERSETLHVKLERITGEPVCMSVSFDGDVPEPVPAPSRDAEGRVFQVAVPLDAGACRCRMSFSATPRPGDDVRPRGIIKIKKISQT